MIPQMLIELLLVIGSCESSRAGLDKRSSVKEYRADQKFPGRKRSRCWTLHRPVFIDSEACFQTIACLIVSTQPFSRAAFCSGPELVSAFVPVDIVAPPKNLMPESIVYWLLCSLE